DPGKQERAGYAMCEDGVDLVRECALGVCLLPGDDARDQRRQPPVAAHHLRLAERHLTLGQVRASGDRSIGEAGGALPPRLEQRIARERAKSLAESTLRT